MRRGRWVPVFFILGIKKDTTQSHSALSFAQKKNERECFLRSLKHKTRASSFARFSELVGHLAHALALGRRPTTARFSVGF